MPQSQTQTRLLMVAQAQSLTLTPPLVEARNPDVTQNLAQSPEAIRIFIIGANPLLHYC
jgi:hypothetical protein